MQRDHFNSRQEKNHSILNAFGREGPRDRHIGSRGLLDAGDTLISPGKGYEVAAPAPAHHDTIALFCYLQGTGAFSNGFSQFLGLQS